jgi:predicted nucleic acid-binding protein
MLAEIRSKFLREGLDPEPPTGAVESLSEIVPLDASLARLAGDEHTSRRKSVRDFGMLDAFLLATARSKDATILTGDPHFRGLPKVEFLA